MRSLLFNPAIRGRLSAVARRVGFTPRFARDRADAIPASIREFVRQRERTAIGVRAAAALTEMTAELAPRSAIEIGFATGVSTVTMLASMPADGQLISVDPHQHDEFGGAGLANVARFGFESRHTFIEEPDYFALPELLRAGDRTFDLAYVDGAHKLEYVMLDAFYLDRMLRVGGVLGFNDCALQPVRTAIDWLVAYRHYEELHTRLGPWPDDRYFRKLDTWKPSWDHFLREMGYRPLERAAKRARRRAARPS